MTTARLTDRFRCPQCLAALTWEDNCVRCPSCPAVYPVRDGMPRFVPDAIHENFAIQWKKYHDVQLDSRNGTNFSRTRLLEQTGLEPKDFKDKTILEVACGAGRFTEVLLSLGARMVSVDYSEAVEACAASNEAARKEGRLVLAQADVFKLPFQPRSFEMVLGFGMLQHTGDSLKALHALWDRVAPGGLLFVDRYQLSLSHTDPFKYLPRPLFAHLPPLMVLSISETTCRLFVPLQRALLPRLQGGGLKRLLRLVINRSPNAVYPINLEVAGKLDPETAFKWSVLDTFDQWAPKFDHPQTAAGWKRDIEALGGEVLLCATGGQGNIAVVRRPK